MSKAIPMDYATLKWCCQAPFEDFFPYGEVREGKHGKHIFINRNANILFVAHLDSVSDARNFSVVEMPEGEYVLSRSLDDRLGAYIGAWWLPLAGVEADILFTDGEEVGRSTAQDFVPDKEYNWMFQFDRAGTDTVMYDYDCPELRDMLKGLNIPVGRGSFTDICNLYHLGCKGINFATAYEEPHGAWARFHVATTVACVNRFMKFYTLYKNEKMPHVHTEKKVVTYESPRGSYYNYGGGFGGDFTRGFGNDYYASNRNRTPAGYKRCDHCYCDVHNEWFISDEEKTCIYCQAGALPEREKCLLCNMSVRVSSIDEDGICVYCNRNIENEQEAKKDEEILEKLYGVGDI